MATCLALVLAAVGDAGPENTESGSVVAGYDGPGPFIYLTFAVVVTLCRWYIPLLAVGISAFFLFGGLADTEFMSRFGTPSATTEFPPGIIVIVVCGGVVALGTRWWTPAFAILVALWIVVGGLLSGQLTANLAPGDGGTVTGNVVMSVGLVVAAIAGFPAMINGRRRVGGIR